MRKWLLLVVLLLLGVISLRPICEFTAALGMENRDKPWAAHLTFRSARILVFAGAYPEARKAFENAVVLFPQYPMRDKAFFWIGLCYEKENNFAAARFWYEDFLKNWPDSLWAGEVRKRLTEFETRENSP